MFSLRRAPPVARDLSAALRRGVRRLHLWLGLTIGALFALLGLTGSALVFYVEIDAALHPAMQVTAPAVAPGWSSPAWDRAYRTVQARWPAAQGEWRFEATDAVATIPARFSGAGGHHGRRMMVWLSADGRRVVRQDVWGAYLMTWLYALHMHLLADDLGSWIVGWSGVAMLMLLVSGLWAWWPRGSWRKALAFKRQAVRQRRLRDLHKHAGLWSLGLLFLLTATGALLALPAERDWLLARVVAPLDKPVTLVSRPTGAPPASLAAILAAGHHALPEATLVWIEIPPGPVATIRLRVRVPGDPSPRFPRSYIHVDRYSAAVLGIVDYRRGGAATTINTWLHPLHDGAIGGLATRILAFLLGFVPAALFVTGLLHWRTRRAGARATRTSFTIINLQGV